jgi:hypothetical protein
MQSHHLTSGDAAPTVDLINVDEQPVGLESLWANGPTLLMFLRHFG